MSIYIYETYSSVQTAMARLTRFLSDNLIYIYKLQSCGLIGMHPLDNRKCKKLVILQTRGSTCVCIQYNSGEVSRPIRTLADHLVTAAWIGPFLLQ